MDTLFPSTLSWRSFLQSLPEETRRKYVARTVDYQKHHAYISFLPEADVEETFLVYFKQMHNPLCPDSPVKSWFPPVPKTARSNPTYTGGHMVSTIRSNVSIVEKFLVYCGHPSAADCRVLKDSLDSLAKQILHHQQVTK